MQPIITLVFTQLEFFQLVSCDLSLDFTFSSSAISKGRNIAALQMPYRDESHKQWLLSMSHLKEWCNRHLLISSTLKRCTSPKKTTSVWQECLSHSYNVAWYRCVCHPTSNKKYPENPNNVLNQCQCQGTVPAINQASPKIAYQHYCHGEHDRGRALILLLQI